MRVLGVIMGVILLTGSPSRGRCQQYQPPCTTTDSCPFDWSCIENRCFISTPEISEDHTSKPDHNDAGGSQDGTPDGSGTDAGRVEGSVDGASMDAGNVEGSVDGTETDYDGDGTNNFEDDDDDDDGKLDTDDDCFRGELNWTSNGNTDHDGDGCKDFSSKISMTTTMVC